MGIPAPTQAPGVAIVPLVADRDEDVAAEDHAWVYTWVSDLGEEGPPSPASAHATRAYDVDGNIQSVTLTMATGVTGPYGINRKRIYRTGIGSDGTTEFLFLTEITASAATYTDSALGSRLGELLPSTTWDPPPDDMVGLIGLPNGVLAGFRGRDLLLSEPYQGHAWPTDYIQVADYEIVGLGSFGTTVVVLTKGRPYLLLGSHPGASSLVAMELDQACVSKRSITRIGQQGVVYASPDGLVRVGPGGGEIISRESYTLKEWRALSPENIVAFYHDGQYVAFLGDHAIASDPDTGGIIEFDQVVRAGYQDRVDDRLYVVQGSEIKEWRTAPEGTETMAEMVWRSRIETGLARNFSTAQVISAADAMTPITFRLLAGGDEAFSQSITSNTPFRLPPHTRSDEWQFEIEGQAEVKEVRVGAMREMLGVRGAAQVAGPRLQVFAASITVIEGGTGTIQARLTAQPTGDVTVAATEASADISLTPASRTFTMADWNVYQAWTVTAVQDADTVDETALVTLTATGAITDTKTVNVTVRDDDTPVLPAAAAPTVAITAVGSVSEANTQPLVVSVTGGTYDVLNYAWVVVSGGGTITGSGTHVTYNPPDVAANTAVQVRCTVTVYGTGGNAQLGTDDTAFDTEDFTVTAVIPVTYYLGVSADASFAPTDFTVMGSARALAVPEAPTWPDGVRRYIGYARPTSLGDYTALYYYPAGVPNTTNRITAWLQEPATIMINGVECTVLRTRLSGRDSSRGRIVEPV